MVAPHGARGVMVAPHVANGVMVAPHGAVDVTAASHGAYCIMVAPHGAGVNLKIIIYWNLYSFTSMSCSEKINYIESVVVVSW